MWGEKKGAKVQLDFIVPRKSTTTKHLDFTDSKLDLSFSVQVLKPLERAAVWQLEEERPPL